MHRRKSLFSQGPLTWVLALLAASPRVQGQAPDCAYVGRQFSGAPGDFDNLHASCSSPFGGAFSAAFTVRFDSLDEDVRVFDFASNTSAQHLMVGLSYDTLYWKIFESSEEETTTTTIWATTPVRLGLAQRYLVTVSASGRMQLYTEGSLVNYDEISLPVSSVDRPYMLVGKSQWDANSPPFKGLIQDLWLWRSEVTWANALTTLASEPETPASALTAVELAVGGGLPSLVYSLRNKSEASVQTGMGVLSVYSVKNLSASAGAPAVVAGERGGKVAFTRRLLQAFGPDALVSVLTIDGKNATQDPFAGVEKGRNEVLATGSIDLTVFGADRKALQPVEPVLFRLPGGSPPPGLGLPSCVYLRNDNGRLSWANDGVRVATNEEILSVGGIPGDGVWCRTNHFSIFTAIANVILGCSNLELLTPHAIDAVTKHEGWWSTRPSIVFFCMVLMLLTFLCMGSVREKRALRYGRTHQDAKKITLCQNIMTFGPMLIKHRYTAFVVYAKDLIMCLWRGKHKLRAPTLTAGVQRCLAMRSGVSMPVVSQHCWNGGKWIDSSAASLPHLVLIHKLEFHCGVAESVILKDELRAEGVFQILHRFVITFFAVHPLLDAVRLGASSMSVRKRATMQVAGFLGVLATNALIFNFSGQMRAWEADVDCPIDPTSMLFIFVATCVSILVNVFPNAFLGALGKQVHGRPCWRKIWWLATLLYLGFAAFLVVVSLANLNPQDQDKWHAGFEWAMVIKLIGMPCAQTIRHQLLLEFFLREDCKNGHKIFMSAIGLRNENEVELNMEEQSTAERMSRRAVSAAELVDFVSILTEKGYLTTKTTVQEVINGPGNALLLAKVEMDEPLPEFQPKSSKLSNQAREKLSRITSPGHKEYLINGIEIQPKPNRMGDTDPNPPDRMVVHSRQGTFIDLVCALIADALGNNGTHEEVYYDLVTSKKYDNLRRKLQDYNCDQTRFWMSMFAQDEERDSPLDWHEELILSYPTIVRYVRRACCDKMVNRIKSFTDTNVQHKIRLPTQLIVLDPDLHILTENRALSEMMLAKSMSTAQDLVPLPQHLKGPRLGNALRRQMEAAKDKSAIKVDDAPWTSPYVKDKKAVYETLWNLAVNGVKQQRELLNQKVDDDLWKDLNMADTATSIIVAARERQGAEAATAGGDEAAADDGGDGGGD